MSSIHDCAKAGDSAAVLRQLENGGDELADQARPSGFTPLHTAAWYGHDDVAAVLLQHGADANRALPNGVAPLFLACRNGHAKVAMLLLGARADLLLERDSDGATALLAAAKHGQTEALGVLLRAGAPIESADRSGSTALLLAAQHSHPGAVEFLLQHGANADCATAGRPNALVLAAYKDDVPTIDAFLRAKPKAINVALPNGATALHMAAACGNVAATQRLLSAGANPARCRSDGQTAASLALANGHEICSAAIAEALARVEPPPALSRMGRLKALQHAGKVLARTGPTSASVEDAAAASAEDAAQPASLSAASSETASVASSGESSDNERPLGWKKLRAFTLVRSALAPAGGGQNEEASSAGDGGTQPGEAGEAMEALKQQIIEASGKLSRKGLAKVMQQLQADHDAEEIDLDSLTEEQLRELSKVALDPSDHSRRHRRSKHRRHRSREGTREPPEADAADSQDVGRPATRESRSRQSAPSVSSRPATRESRRPVTREGTPNTNMMPRTFDGDPFPEPVPAMDSARSDARSDASTEVSAQTESDDERLVQEQSSA